MSNTLGCLFAEEIGEALLSRLSARVKLHPTALSQPALMDLFLSMPHPRMGTKTLHGKLRTGQCGLFRARLRRFIAWCTGPQLLLAPSTTAKTTAFVGLLPEGHTFPKPIPDSVNEAALRKVFRRSVLLLLSNRSPPEGVTEYLDQCNFRRDPAEVAQLTSLMERLRTRNRRGKGGGEGKGAPDADDANAPDRFVGVEDDHISVSSADSVGSLGHLVVDVDTMSDAPPPPLGFVTTGRRIQFASQ